MIFFHATEYISLVWIANPAQREQQGDTEHPPRRKECLDSEELLDDEFLGAGATRSGEGDEVGTLRTVFQS